MFVITTGQIIQLFALPFLDLVLMSSTAIIALAWNTFLSVKCLGEELNLSYDLPAFTLMGAGTVTLVMASSTTEKTLRTKEIIIEMFTSNQSLCFAVFSMIFLTVSVTYFKHFERQLQLFQ